ncbi:MAG: hypothetical protein H7144_08210, partial [Burkholderiales bacterium]|nr:hypothetical protein [Phycisphaerae bacterium]
RLQPVADAVQQMLAKARDAADAAAARAQNNWPAGKAAWERADQQTTIAEYTRNIISYSAGIARDRADPERDKMLVAGADYLTTFDNDENPNRADVRFYIAKLNMARATPESLEAARQGFAFVQQKGKPDNIAQQFESRFFTAVTEINARNAPAAGTALGAVSDWVKQQKIDTKPEVATALAALRYRVAVLNADLAKSPAEKEKHAQTADDVLDKLQQSQPGLRGLIMELLGARVSANTPIAGLNGLMLQSLRTKAEAETIKSGPKTDVEVIERGLAASIEIIRRGGDDNRQAIADSYYVAGFFHQRLGRPEAAAAAFLEFVDRYKSTDKERSETSFSNAIALVGELYRTKLGEPEVTRLYDRVLTMAVQPPFERMEFAFELARRLQATGKLDEAIAMFAKVPADRKEAADARYFMMVAIHDKIATLKPDDRARGQLLVKLQELADQVNQTFGQQLGSADEARKKVIRTRLSQTRVVAANVAMREQKDPKRAVELLKDFEKTVTGLPNETALMGEVLLIRVQSYVQENRVTEATAELVRLAEQRPAETGQIVFNLLQKLDEQVTAAEAAGRREEIGQLERNRAALTPFYVKWIQENTNPELKKHAYSAAVFDADTQRRAAELTTDLPRRAELLAAALKRFQELDTQEHVKEFLELQPSDKRKQLKYDPQVKLGLARVLFSQGDYKETRLPLALLFRDKVLGDGVLVKAGTDGKVTEGDNPTYWEAMHMLIRSNVALNDNVEGMKRWLRDQSVVYGDQVGGARWRSEFMALQKELGIQPSPVTSPTP